MDLDISTSLGISCTNFKCFREGGFETIKPLNIIIGKNNSGKSTLIDLIQAAVTNSSGIGYLESSPQINVQLTIDKEFANKAIGDIDGVPDYNRESVLENFLYGLPLAWTITGNQKLESKKNFVENATRKHGSNHERIFNNLFKAFEIHLINPFSKYKFSRILADRDIAPEIINPEIHTAKQNLIIQPNGTGATIATSSYLQDTHLNIRLIEELIVEEFNKITNPDIQIKRIFTRRTSNTWELHLDERGKGLVPLSRAGSGAKTILLTLLHLHVMPDILQHYALKDYIFGFEELENNLHPSLQRRLFVYLRNFAETTKCRFFITTHSHVVIDLFAKDKDAQTIHVTHDTIQAKATRVLTRIGQGNIFDDLEVRASDLLQTNAIIWVEGPSDRIYFNRWVEIWSGGQLQEHVDYEFVFTAGTLLSHIDFADPEIERETIEALKINPHAILMVDSDKTSEDTALKERVIRTAEEVSDMGGMAWITAGNEVENYIPHQALTLLLNNKETAIPDHHDDVFDFIEANKGGKFHKRKTDLAERICQHLTHDMIANHLDLTDRLNEVCDKLRKWNYRD